MDQTLTSLPPTETDLHIQQVAHSLEISFEEAKRLAKKFDEIDDIGCVEVDEQGNVIPRRPILITEARDAKTCEGINFSH